MTTVVQIPSHRQYHLHELVTLDTVSNQRLTSVLSVLHAAYGALTMSEPPSTPPRSSPARPSGNLPTIIQTPPRDSYTSLSSLIDVPSKRRSSASSQIRGLDLSTHPLPTVDELSDGASSAVDGSVEGNKKKKHGRFAIGDRAQQEIPSDGYGATADAGRKKFKKKKLGLWSMIALTISMGGSQVSKRN